MQNPAFRNAAFQNGAQGTNTAVSAERLQEMYEQPAYQRPETEPMTIQDSLLKSTLAFTILIAGAVVGWIAVSAALQNATTTAPAMGIFIGAGLVALVLGFVNVFKREPSPALILLFAAAQGVLVGGISMFYEIMEPGIVFQAVLATLVVVGVTLALFASGKIRASKKATKIFLIVMVAYLAFSLINVVLMLTGAVDDPWGLRGSVTIFGIPLGVVLGLLAVLLGAYSLVLDFDFIQRGVRSGAPKRYGWTAAFGIMVTVVWLYLEILRLIAIARR
ncbi:MAG TPA: Bax inhibitor-1/YccA family protein [Microbacteriaceae bacterium]|nr:Bax inhibitor-1/YccA family protein [Microbacteriaceae bacterium]